jgi:ABC-type transport system involved in multi-copper enzyme maturation permease subunit
LLDIKRAGTAAPVISSGGPGMIFQIAKKDFLNNLLSARFIIGFILCLFLIPFSILININDFRDQANQYRIDRAATDKNIKEVRVYSALRPEIVLAPEPLTIFSRGLSGQVGNRVKIRLGEKAMLAEGKSVTGDNPFLASFFSVDFVQIAAIVFSLLALLFSYDVFTKEKEDGTLRLQMSNSVGRSQFLAGKVLGILVTLLPVLVFSFLLSAVLILFSKNVSFSALEWGRIVLLFIISLLYLAVFIFIGLFISARSKTSVTSLVLCLFVWVFFIFIVPNLSSYIAESFVRVQSRDNLNRVLEDLNKEFSRTKSDRYKAQSIPETYNLWRSSSGLDGYEETYGNSRTEFEAQRRRSAISEPLRIEYADKKWAHQEAYLESLAHQARVAEKLSAISPAGVFRIIAAAVCSTDKRSHENEMDRIRQYREAFIRYLQSKNIFASFRYITPALPETFLTEDQLIEKRTGGEFKTAQAYYAWAGQQNYNRASWLKLSKNKVPGDEPSDFPYLDASDMPVFQERPKSLLSGLESSILNIALLIIESILLFYIGYVAFIRYDVR